MDWIPTDGRFAWACTATVAVEVRRPGYRLAKVYREIPGMS